MLFYFYYPIHWIKQKCVIGIQQSNFTQKLYLMMYVKSGVTEKHTISSRQPEQLKFLLSKIVYTQYIMLKVISRNDL